MKKAAVILFTLYYLFSAGGFSVDMHWCGKKMQFVSFNSSHEKKCPCGKKMPSGCCRDVHVKVKHIENQQSASALVIPKNNVVKCLFESIVPFSTSLFSEVKHLAYSPDHSPPLLNDQPVYLVNGVFLI